MRTVSTTPKKLNRWMRLGIATVTSTALVGGVVVAAPAHPLLPAAQVAQAQTVPVEAEAYAFAEQLNLSAPGVRELLSTDDERGVDAILQLLEAEQSWDGAPDDDQAADISEIELELLGLLDIEVSGLTLPLIGENGLLQGELGALRAYANAPASDEARAATGVITDTGSVDLSGTGVGGNARLDLTTLLGLDDALAGLLDEASLNLGALSSAAWNEEGVQGSEYQIADAELTVDSPLVGEAVDGVLDLVGGLDGTLNSLLGQEGVLNDIVGLVSGLGAIIGTGIDVSAEIPLEDISNSLLADPLEDENGLVSIDLVNGQINVDLAQLHAGDLNDLPANTPLVSAAELTQITETVTSLLTDGATENPNGLNARLQNVLMGDEERGGLYGTEVNIELALLGALAGVELRTTLGGLLNADVERTEDETLYESDNYGYYLMETVGLADLLGGLLELLQPLVGAVGTVVEGLLFGEEAEEGLLSGLVGNVQDGVIAPLLTQLDPLLEGVLQPLADIRVNRQEDDGELFKVSALEVSLLSDALVLPIATSAVAAGEESDDGDADGLVITPIDDQDGVVGEEITPVEVEVNDPEADVNVDDLPDGVDYNPETGQIEGTPEADTEGSYDVVVTASNDEDTVTEEFTFTVTDGEGDDNGNGDDEIDAPEISPIDDQEGVVGEVITPVEVEVTGEEVEVEVVGLPEGVEYNPETDRIEGTPAEGTEDTHTVTVTATNEGGTASEAFIFLVTDGEDEGNGGDDDVDTPEISPIDDQEGVVGEEIEPIEIVVIGEDFDVEVEGLPDGVVYNPETGSIEGTPAEGTEDTYTVTVTATNDGGTDSVAFVFVVTDGGDGGNGGDNGSGPGGSLPGSSEGDNGSGDLLPGGSSDLFPGSSNGENGNGTDGNSSSEQLQQCLASPETGLAALLAVLGVTAAVSGPVVDPIVRAVGEQFSAQVRQLTGSTPENDPEWLNQINAGLAEASQALDSRIVATALFGAGALALIFADDLCGTGNEGLSSQLSS